MLDAADHVTLADVVVVVVVLVVAASDASSKARLLLRRTLQIIRSRIKATITALSPTEFKGIRLQRNLNWPRSRPGPFTGCKSCHLAESRSR